MTVHRIWYINTGSMTPNKAHDYLERIRKNFLKNRSEKEKEYLEYFFGVVDEPTRLEIVETSE